MIRLLLLAGLAALAGCGEAEQKAKAPPKPDAIRAGQWQSSLEVTHMRSMDKGRPRLDRPPGTRIAGGACVGPGAVSRPPVELFVGNELQDCEYTNFYMRAGRINTQLACRRTGLQGDVGASVTARFTGETIDGTLAISTFLVTDGDVVVTTRFSARRTGDCAAPQGG